MNKNNNGLITVLLIIVIILLIVAGVLGFFYIRHLNETARANDLAKQSQDSSSNTDGSTGNTDGSGSKPDEGGTTDPGTAPDEPSGPATKKIVCSNWIYNIEGKTSPVLYLVYDDSAKVTFKNVNPECVDIEMHYKEATLYLTYSHGEAQAVAFPSGTEVLSLKTGKTPYGNTATLAREKFTVTAKDSKGVSSYWLHYVSLQSKTDCNTFDEMAGKVIGYPCYIGANPFVTPAGRFDLSIAKGTSSDEIVKLATYFDKVAKNSYFTPAK